MLFVRYSFKAKALLNLDTEEWPVLYAGCAGGGDVYVTMAAERENASTDWAAHTRYTLLVDGLRGGHRSWPCYCVLHGQYILYT